MALNATQRGQVERVLRRAPDSTLAQPLWNFHPSYRPAVLAERTRRGLLQGDPEPIGDSEYS